LESGLGFKTGLVSVFGIFLLAACGDIPRDNGLDPKNPDSFRPAKILIEAFVNTNNPLSHNQDMLTALDSLSVMYPDRLVIAEYHRNAGNYQDPYHLDSNELLYLHYLDAIGSSHKGVPDAFINGIRNRVQGCSSVHSAVMRLQQVILDELKNNSLFTLELACRIHSGKVIPEVTISKLGRDPANAILLKAVLVSSMPGPSLKRVVRGGVKGSLIPVLYGGAIQNVSLPEMAFDPSIRNRLIVAVMDQNENSVYQCESLEVP